MSESSETDNTVSKSFYVYNYSYSLSCGTDGNQEWTSATTGTITAPEICNDGTEDCTYRYKFYACDETVENPEDGIFLGETDETTIKPEEFQTPTFNYDTTNLDVNKEYRIGWVLSWKGENDETVTKTGFIDDETIQIESLKLAPPEAEIKIDANSKMTVVLTEVPCATSYEILYSTNPDMSGAKTFKATSSYGEWTIDLLANRNYWVQFRSIGSEKYEDSDWSTPVQIWSTRGQEAHSTVVTTLADVVDANDGLISLREAIQYASSGGTVTFSDWLEDGTIELASTLTINKNITIDASKFQQTSESPALLTLKGSGGAVIQTEASTSVTLVGLNITGGTNSGVNANGTSLVMRSCSVYDNHSEKDGGGIAISTGTADLSYVTLTRNSSEEWGGAIGNNGTSLNLDHITVSENSAYDAGGVSNRGVLVVTNSDFTNNTAEQQYGALYSKTTTTTISNCTFSGNLTTYRSTVSIIGGTANISSTAFTGNHGRYGGSLWLREVDVVTISGCTFIGEVAEGDGGAIYANDNDEDTIIEIKDSKFLQNTSYQIGGAINIYKGNLLIENCEFTENKTVLDTGSYFSYLSAGALHLENTNSTIRGTKFVGNSSDSAGAIEVLHSELLIENCEFTENTALSGSSGGIAAYDTVLCMKNSTFTGNTADGKYGSGGALYCNESSESSWLSSDPLPPSSLQIDSCVFTGNIAHNRGGAMDIEVEDAVITNCQITDNQVQILEDSYDSYGYGGGIYTRKNMTITNCTIANNRVVNMECDASTEGTASSTAGNGEGICIESYGDKPILRISNSIITSNGESDIVGFQATKVYGEYNLSAFTKWDSGTGNIVWNGEDKIFEDAQGMNYQLSKDSVAANIIPESDNQNGMEVSSASSTRRKDAGAFASKYTALSAPSLNVSFNNQTATVNLGWVSGASSYVLEYSKNLDFAGASVVRNTYYYAQNVTISNLTAGARYYFRVKACGNGSNSGDSAWSVTSMCVPVQLDYTYFDSDEVTALAEIMCREDSNGVSYGAGTPYYGYDFRIANPWTWPGTCWELNDSDGKYHITAISFNNLEFRGELNFSGFSQLKSLVISSSNGNFTKLDLSGCSSLQSVSTYVNLHEIDLSGCDSLTELELYNSSVTSLDLTDCNKISVFRCSSANISSITFGNQEYLKIINCSFNELTSFDLSQARNLEYLWCGDNQIKELDLTNCTKLKTLDCDQNELTSLKVPHTATLTSIMCRWNSELKELDLTGCSGLIDLFCSYIENLDLASCTSLQTLYAGYSTVSNISNCTSLASAKCCYVRDAVFVLPKTDTLKELELWGRCEKLDASGATGLTSLYVNGGFDEIDLSGNSTWKR